MFIFCSDKKDFSGVSHCIMEHPKQQKFEKHLHYNYELLLLIRGDVTCNINGQSYSLLPYDLVFIPSHSYHFITPNSNEPYENYVIHFNHSFICESQINKLFVSPFIKNIFNADKLRRMFSNFDFYHETYSITDFEEAARHLLNEILIFSCYLPLEKKELVSQSNESIEPDIASYISKNISSGLNADNLYSPSELSFVPDIVSYISKNITAELNADIIAQEFSFSKSYIKNCFSLVMGIGIQQYINQRKIRAAQVDIQNGMEINRTAEKYGYKDYSSFYRQYVKIVGKTPSETRKQIL